MNILFMSMYTIDSLNDGYIYADLIKQFSEDGHNCYALTPIKQNVKSKTHVDECENCKIIKVKVGQIAKVNKIKKVVNLFLLEHKTIAALKKYTKDVKFDLVIPMVSSLCLLKTVEYIKKRDKAAVYMLLKDIFPQNAVDMNLMSQDGIIYKFFRKKEKQYYNLCDYIGCLSPANVDYLNANNVFKNKVIIECNSNSIYLEESAVSRDVENLVVDNEELEKEIKETQVFLEKYKIDKNKTTFFYGGNLGVPQGIDFILDCIDEFEKKDNCCFFIIGNGTEFSRIEKHILKNNILNTKSFKAIPQHEYEKLVKLSDVGIVFLDSRFTIPNYPSRTLLYLQSKLPIIYATDLATDAGDIAEQNNFGFKCDSLNTEKFFKAVDTLSNNHDLISQMGENGYNFLITNFSTKVSLNIILNHFKENTNV